MLTKKRNGFQTCSLLYKSCLNLPNKRQGNSESAVKAAYKVDDILDECATKSSQLESEKVHFDRFSPSNILFCCNIGNRMRDIRERLDEIAQVSFE